MQKHTTTAILRWIKFDDILAFQPTIDASPYFIGAEGENVSKFSKQPQAQHSKEQKYLVAFSSGPRHPTWYSARH